jgi:ADP-ribosyl-[dinitrogen reductase] hydrolase
MRLAPIATFYRNDADALLRFAADSTRTTHGAPEAIEASRLFAMQLRLALSGASRDEVLFGTGYHAAEPRIAALARGDWRHKTANDVRGTGYVVASLEAALWCFLTTDSFADAILRAANLGDDADTTAAICGQIAGAFYGAAGIPGHWIDRLVMRDDISALADDLLRHRFKA